MIIRLGLDPGPQNEHRYSLSENVLSGFLIFTYLCICALEVIAFERVSSNFDPKSLVLGPKK